MKRDEIPNRLHSELKSPENSQKFSVDNIRSTTKTQVFLLGYVCDKENFFWNDKQRVVENWKFFLRVLTLTRHSYFFGHFKRDELLLIPRMKEILETEITPSTDKFLKTMKGSSSTEEETQLLIVKHWTPFFFFFVSLSNFFFSER